MTLQVVAAYNNPMRWAARLANFRRFEEGMVATPGVHLTTVELTYGGRAPELPLREEVQRVRLQTRDILWQKENLINIGVGKVPDPAAPIMFVDGDMLFADPSWVSETIATLQLHPMAQVSTDIVWLGPKGQFLGSGKSHMEQYRKTRFHWRKHKHYHVPICALDEHGYPGAAWAFTRQAWETLGGLLEVCILGAGDFHMAMALHDLPDLLLTDNDYTPSYRAHLAAWKARAAKLEKDIGSVPATVFHLWHGKLANRGYSTREQILIRNHYDPDTDICRRTGDLIELTGNKPDLRDDLREYFEARNEDSVDL